MKAWVLLAALCAPLTLSAAEAPAPPVIQVPEATAVPVAAPVFETAPQTVTAPLLAEPTPQTVRAPQLPDPTPVADAGTQAATIRVYARDPKAAFAAALWPGFFLHGWGHHVAGDQETFLNLAGGELFGVIMLTFGLSEALGPDIKGESKATSQSIAIAGGAIFATTWLWDLTRAGAAATRFNRENHLSLAPREGGAQVALNTRF